MIEVGAFVNFVLDGFHGGSLMRRNLRHQILEAESSRGIGIFTGTSKNPIF